MSPALRSVFVGAAPGRICSYPGDLPGPSVRFAAADGARRAQRLSGHGCLFPEKSARSYAWPDRPGMSGRNNRSPAPFIMVWVLRLSPLSDRRAIGPVFSDWHGDDAHGVRPIRLRLQPDRDWQFMRDVCHQSAGFPRRVAGFGATGPGAPRGVCPGRYSPGLDLSAWRFLRLSVVVSLPVLVERVAFALRSWISGRVVWSKAPRPGSRGQTTRPDPRGQGAPRLALKTTGPAFPRDQCGQRGRVFRRRRHYNFS